MSDSVYEPEPRDGDDAVVDLDQAFGDEGVDELMATSYSPPEKPRAMDRFGTTAAEQQRGETLDQRLAQEEPDPAMDVDLAKGATLEGTNLAGDVDVGEENAEVGDARSGRLVDLDEGVRGDDVKELVGTDVGVDAAASSAEEAAVHIIDESEADRRLARDRAGKRAFS